MAKNENIYAANYLQRPAADFLAFRPIASNKLTRTTAIKVFRLQSENITPKDWPKRLSRWRKRAQESGNSGKSFGNNAASGQLSSTWNNAPSAATKTDS